MANNDARISKLEAKIDRHLEESGEVREALVDLKLSVNRLTERMWNLIVGSALMLLATVGFLLKVTLWK